MKKVLFTATVDSHILAFHTPFLKYFKENGYEVHVATNGTDSIPYCDKKHVITFERSPFKIKNIKAIEQLKKIVDAEHYDIVHTHTPMGSVVTRLATLGARKNGMRVIYTAHGFHFFKGAPMLNWLIFYPIEKILANYTDILITINKEDYELAKSKFKTDVKYVPGVGIDPKKFDFKMTKRQKAELRQSLGLADDDFVMIYPAELSKRKNQLWLIESIADLIKNESKFHLLLPGKDSLNGKCQNLVNKLGLESNIHFLGFRKDIPQLLKISNLALSSSFQEGLPVNIMEAMYSRLPIITTDCRGNRDLIENNINGYIIKQRDAFQMLTTIKKISLNYKTKQIICDNNDKNMESYLLSTILEKMAKIYGKN